MSFVNFSNEVLSCTGRIRAPLTRNQLVYVSTMFDKTIHRKKIFDQTLNSSNPAAILLQETENRDTTKKYFTKKYDLQLEPYEKPMHFSKNLM